MRTHTEHAASVRALVDPVLASLARATPELLEIGEPELNGRVTAAPIVATDALPPFDNSQMDGYAVRVVDLQSGTTTLRIGQTTAAGDAPIPHEPGTAAPVMTGAAIPIGADAVIPIEQAMPPRFTELLRAGEAQPQGTVSFAKIPPAGAFVRPRGSDLPRGATILPAGTRLTPARVGLLASAGVAEVPVRPRPRILLVSTGDEVALPRAALGPGQIHDANTPLLAALLREARAVVRTARSTDDAAALWLLLDTLAPHTDLIITSGGISAGAFEVVRETLASQDVEFGGIALQPGGPQGHGTIQTSVGPIPVLCFPGNPVSSALSAELFVMPLLRGYAGRPEYLRSERRPLGHDVTSPLHKHQVRRGRLDAAGNVLLTGPSSHLLADLAAAEILAHIPVGIEQLPAGTPIDLWRLDD